MSNTSNTENSQKIQTQNKIQEGEVKVQENKIKQEQVATAPVHRGSEEELKEVYSDFKIAINNGNVNKLKDILEQFNQIYDLVNQLDPQSRQISTFLAANYPDDQIAFEMMKLLFDYGANASFRDHINQSVLFYVARDGQVKCFDLLMEKNIDVNDSDNSGQTAIFFAARDNRAEIIKRMLNYSVNCYKIDSLCSQTPLFYAARQGHTEVCKLLMENGCKPDHQDMQQQTAIHFARKFSRKDAIDVINQYNSKVQEESQNDKDSVAGGGKDSVAGGSNLLSKRKGKETAVQNIVQLVFTDEKGNSKDITEEEFEKEFKQQYPDIAKILLDPDENITQEMLANAKNDDPWERVAKQIVSSLWKLKGCTLFHAAVDPKKYGIEDYFDIVQNPMDLGTVKNKLNSNVYTKPKDFVRDMDLIFHNCVLYNGTESDVGQTGIAIRKQWENLKGQNNFEQYLQNAAEAAAAAAKAGN